MELRRVVVTGLGAVTPLGAGVSNVWDLLLKSESGATEIQSFDTKDLSVKIACQVPTVGSDPGVFNPDDHLSPKDQRKMDQFIIFALGAAAEAIEDSGWMPNSDEDAYRTGVMIGSGNRWA